MEKFLKNMKSPKTGKLTAINGKDIQLGGRKENTVHIDGKMVPQCCVKKV